MCMYVIATQVGHAYKQQLLNYSTLKCLHRPVLRETENLADVYLYVYCASRPQDLQATRPITAYSVCNSMTRLVIQRQPIVTGSKQVAMFSIVHCYCVS